MPVVASSEFNAIDGSAPPPLPPFPETMGAAPAAEPDVQLVAAAEFNDIDRKADDASALPAAAAPIADAAPAASSNGERLKSAAGHRKPRQQLPGCSGCGPL